MKEGQEVGEGCGQRWSQGMGQQLLQFECELLFMYVCVHLINRRSRHDIAKTLKMKAADQTNLAF